MPASLAVPPHPYKLFLQFRQTIQARVPRKFQVDVWRCHQNKIPSAPVAFDLSVDNGRYLIHQQLGNDRCRVAT